MNIFASHTDPGIAARNLDDVRINSQVKEAAQLLCTALRLHGVEDEKLYRKTHQHHPVCSWVVSSRPHFDWLVEHGLALGSVYADTRYKIHACVPVIRYASGLRQAIPDNGWVDHHNSAANDSKGISFKHIPDVYEAYRRYLVARWSTDNHKVTFIKRGEPEWRKSYV